MSSRCSRNFVACTLAIVAFAFPACMLKAQQPQMPDLQWRLVGPFRGGRTRAACGVASEPNVFYVGQVDGGVWKSTDYGRTWHPIFDKEPSQSVGAIAVAPSNPDIVYVASGEGLHRPDLSVGDGIYRSKDAGKTWEHLGLREGEQIPALAVDPHDPNRLFAAVLGHPYGPNQERGIYRSTDGGQTWKQVLFKDANTGGSDVVIDPANPNVVYASLWESRLGPWEDGNEYDGTRGGLFKSTDGGDTWHVLTQGLPADLVQINVAIAASQSSRLFATVSTTREGGYESGDGLGFYRSDDAGESWYRVTEDARPAMKIGGGDLPVPLVDPKNPDVVYSASIVTMRSTDGGKTWSGLRGAPGGDDYQNLWINPNDPQIILLVSDQGALVSVNGGQTWSSWYNQPTAQLYHVAVTNTFPYQICAGQQESGSVCIASRGNDGQITQREWHPVGIIEYGYAAPDPLHPEIVYGAGRTEVSRFDMRTGQTQNMTPAPVHEGGIRADRTEPILFSPVDPHMLFYAANRLFLTRDSGKTWQVISPDLSREHAGQPASLQPLSDKEQAKRRGAIYSLAPSFKDENTIWAGTDDGLVWMTHDLGKTWKDITPPALTPWCKVTQISASRFDENTAYISVSRFRVDDLHAYIYRTHDGGATWQSISAGLPENAPVNVVREDPVRKGMLYAGTETGIWLSLDDGNNWQSIAYNLPHTSMRDLMVHDDDLIVATHGRSFWVLDDVAPLRQMDKPAAQAGPYLFTPGAAYRVRRSTYTDTPMPPDEPMGQNPPDGAAIDFTVPADVKGPVVLEILDAQNNVVRRYASDDKPESTEADLAKQLIPLYWLRMPATLPGTPGMHRWVWDLHETPVAASNYEYPISAVPHATPRVPQGVLALPGAYTVRLTVGDTTLTAPLTVKMDPRVVATGADLDAQHAVEKQLEELLNAGAKATLAAHSAREQAEHLLPEAPGELKQPLQRLDDALNELLSGSDAPNGTEDKPGLDAITNEARELYLQVGQADAAPTAAQLKASSQIAGELRAAQEEWAPLEKVTIPQLDQKLRELQLKEIDLTRQPSEMPSSGDED